MSFLNIASDEQLKAVLFDSQHLTLYPGGLVIPASTRAIRQGDPIAINTSTDKGLVAKYSQFAGNEAQGQTVLSLDDVHPFAVGDVVVLDDGAALQETVTITAVDYTNNTITVTPAVADAGGFSTDEHASVVTNDVDEPIGVGLLPLRDKDAAKLGFGANDITPAEGDSLYGSVAITGRFKRAILKNFAGTGNRNAADLGGSVIGALDVLVITTPNNTNLILT